MIQTSVGKGWILFRSSAGVRISNFSQIIVKYCATLTAFAAVSP